jgi:hypothetical protein
MADELTPDKLASAVTSFIADARLKAAGGLTVAEFGQLVVELLHILVTGLDSIATLDGPAKKAWALGCIGVLFDATSPALVPVWLAPVWLVIRPAVRQLVIAAAGGALEQILKISRAPSPAPEKTT